MPLSSYLEKNKESVQALLSLLEILGETDVIQRTKKLEVIGNTGLVISDTSKRDRQLQETGYFSELEITLFLSQYIPSNQSSKAKQNNITFLRAILDPLLKHALLRRAPPPIEARYAVDGERLAMYRLTGFAENIIFGTGYMMRRYAASIPAVNIEDRNGDQHCGTGVFLRFKSKNKVKSYILTNRHVVERNSIISIVAGSTNYNIIDDPILCKFSDLALVEVQVTETVRPLCFLGRNPDVLEDIITVGYPRVPQANAQYALAHKGEVNGQVFTTNDEQFMAISCHLSPGNSGGPVLNYMGECVGIVAETKTWPI